MRQQSIEIEGLKHEAPIPLGCRVGPVLVTSAISGRDTATGTLPPDPDGQARFAFENLKKILAAGGMDLGDVVKLTVFTTDDGFRNAVNKYWIECYPDPKQRPARHTMVMPLRGGALVQLEAMAIAR